MYYSDEIIEEVRARNPIVDVIGSYVHLQKKGANYFGLCPFHSEKSPSFSVSPSKQMYHCFGCGVGGNVLTFIMDYENFSFQEAMQMLAERAGIELPKQETTAEMRREADERQILLKIHKDAATFYYRTLKTPQGKPGYDYLKRRGVSDDMIRTFGLGYAGTHPAMLYRYLKEQGYSDRQLKDSGLVSIREKGTGDRFWNRVMFPIMDANNRVIAFGGRVMGDGEPKYLNSPETKIFDKSRNLYGLNIARRTREKYFLVCEGYMDVISMHQAGFTNAVASLGTAFTTQHGMIMKRYTDEVILCYDNDGAGRKAALRAIPILKEAGLRIKVLSLEPYKDPDEFIKNLGSDEFKKRIDAAVNAETEGILMSTGYSYLNCRLLSEMAEVIGREEDAVRYRNLAGKVREAFLNRWHDGRGRVGKGSQGAQAFAL
ncbi:MAG: DNA primase, partial [Lachnospiraceae bacterium]|nr:DNA primase [Lachnospiraceae bacterium]